MTTHRGVDRPGIGPTTGRAVAEVLALFRTRGELTRTEVINITGLSRSTVNQRLNALVAAGLLVPVGGGESTGGRPSSRFAVNGGRAIILTADIGASGFVAAACDLLGTPLRHVTRAVNVWEGPDRVLNEVLGAFRQVQAGDEVWGIGVAVPGPVEFAAGRVVNPPLMTGWHQFDITGWFAGHYKVATLVENDANARAVAESRQGPEDNLISLKLGTGIGAGLVFNGLIIRGEEGAAGDIGHTRAVVPPGSPELQCRCGNLGCVEAYAGGWALVRDLNDAGLSVTGTDGVVDLVRSGQSEAIRLVRNAGRVIGEAVADLVSILNPRTLVISGRLAASDEVLLSGIREKVYQRTAPLATRRLSVRTSALGELAGVVGLAFIVTDHIFGGDALASLPTSSRVADESDEDLDELA
jgi:predicted NBD/HSP70 family sugar kinase